MDGNNETNREGANCNILDDYSPDSNGVYHNEHLIRYVVNNICYIENNNFTYKSFRPNKN